MAINFWEPINKGEYFLVIIIMQTLMVGGCRICTNTRAVIPKLDRVFSSLGIPMVVGSDNRPPFKGQDFLSLRKYLGFKTELKRPESP